MEKKQKKQSKLKESSQNCMVMKLLVQIADELINILLN